MQILVREILARRAPSPPAEYLALQVNRLNEAMIVAYGSMAGGNLKAVDRVVGIVSEMDRYHGFFPRRESAGQSAPARPAGSRTARACAAAGSEARWKSRCNRLKRLNSAIEIDRAPLARRRPAPSPPEPGGYFLTSGQAESASLPNASSPFIVLRSL
jgi:hypothetical protein